MGGVGVGRPVLGPNQDHPVHSVRDVLGPIASPRPATMQRAIITPNASMRHQYRQGHAPEHAAGGAAEHEIAGPRVGEGAHHHQIGPEIAGA